jgi:putative transposase
MEHSAGEASGLLVHTGSSIGYEGFARRLNRSDGTAGHVWESRYQDVALIDGGGVLAGLVYVDLNPFRAGLVEDPLQSDFCSARHRLKVDKGAADAVLGAKLCRLSGYPLLNVTGEPLGTWSVTSRHLAELNEATARLIRQGTGGLPSWAEGLLPRLGVVRDQWDHQMKRAGMMAGNVLGSHVARRAQAGAGRMPSDKSGLFGEVT